MIFREIITEEKLPYYDKLMRATLQFLAFRLGIQDYNYDDQQLPHTKYSIKQDTIWYRFIGYKTESKARPQTIEIFVSHFTRQDGLFLERKYQFANITDKKSEPLSTEIAAMFMELANRIAQDKIIFQKFVAFMTKKFPRAVIGYHTNKIRFGNYLLELISYNNTWYLKKNAFDSTVMKTTNPQEILDFLETYNFEKVDNVVESVDDPVLTDSQKAVGALSFLSKMLDEDIVESPKTLFRQTYNGLIRLPEVFIRYDGLQIGYERNYGGAGDRGAGEDIKILIEHPDPPESEIHRRKYAIISIDDYPEIDSAKLAYMVKAKAIFFKKEVEGYYEIAQFLPRVSNAQIAISNAKIEFFIDRKRFVVKVDEKNPEIFHLESVVNLRSGTPEVIIRYLMNRY